MKYAIATILFILIQTTIYAQQPFEKTDEVYAYLVENNITESAKGVFRAESKTTFLPRSEFDNLAKSKKSSDHKIVTLYNHVVEGEVKTPSGRLLILPIKESIPKSISYTKTHPTSKYIIINVVNSPYKSLEEAYNQLSSKNWVKEIDILYSNSINLLSDPFYPQQYFLNNTGQFGGTAGVDINVEDAWKLTTGSSSVKVAIIDNGTEDHLDLEDGSGVSRIVDGHTPQTSGNGSGLSTNPAFTGL